MNVAGGAGCGWCLGALVGAFVAHLTQSDEGGIWWVLHWVVCIAVGGGVGGRLGSGWTRDGEAEVDADSREDRESHP